MNWMSGGSGNGSFGYLAVAGDQPCAADSAHYRLCDSLMLDLMHRHAGQMQPVFKALFLNNPIERVLRFLDESASPAENAQLIASLPPKPFLQALWKMPARASLAQFVAGGAEQ